MTFFVIKSEAEYFNSFLAQLDHLFDDILACIYCPSMCQYFIFLINGQLHNDPVLNYLSRKMVKQF